MGRASAGGSVASRRARVLADAVRLVSASGHDLEGVLDALTEQACRLLGCDAAAVHLAVPGTESFRRRLGRGMPQQARWGPGTLFEAYDRVRDAFASGAPLFSPDLHAEPRVPDDVKTDLDWAVSDLIVPLVAGGERVGVLFANWARRVDLGAADLDAAGALGAHAAVAIRTARLLEEARASEARYRRIVETTQVEADGRTVFASDRLAAMLGYTPAELIGRKPSTFLDEASRAAVGSVGPAHRGGEAQRMELTYRRKDGTSLRAIVAATPEVDAEGRFVGSTAIVTDVTEQRRAEEATRTSAERLRLVARATNDAVWDCDLTTDTVWWNEGVCTLFGYRSEEVGHDRAWWQERVHPEDRARVVDGIKAAIARGDDVWSDEYQFSRADGSVAHVLDRGYLLRDDAGRLVRMVGAMLDLTERTRMAKDLRASEERYRTLARHFPDGVVALFDHDLRCVLVEGAGLSDLGFTREAMEGRRVVEVVPPVVGDALDAPCRAALGGVSTTTELPHDRGAVEARVVPVADPDGVVRHGLLTLRDVTERAEAERERLRSVTREAETEKMRALGQLAAGVAHDLNQSLALIAGYGEIGAAHLARNDGDQAVLAEALGVVQQAAFDGGASVRRLLTFARQREQGQPEQVDLGSLLAEVARLTAPRWRDAAQAEGRPISLRVETGGNLGVLGWPGSLREALTNLVFNAVDAMPQGGTIRMRADRRGGEVVVEVRDTGTGMPPEIRARAFEPFFTTKGEHGSGIGLAQVYGIAQRHGGWAEIDSSPGAGTTVRLALPATSAAPPTSPDGEDSVVTGLRVLVVDDEPRLAQAVIELLRRDEHRARAAASGEEALAVLGEERVDAVLTDLSLGAGINGWEVARRVAERWPSVAVVLLTGWGSAIDIDLAHERGVDMVLAKPFSGSDLRRALTAARARADARAQLPGA